jgi:hypothetical protein
MKTEFFRASIVFTGLLKRQRKIQRNIETLDKRFEYSTEGANAAISAAKAWAKANIKEHKGDVILMLNHVEHEGSFETYQPFSEKNKRVLLNLGE